MTGDHRCNGSPKTPGAEICNGLDDDCDGKVDELDSASNRTSDDKLIYFAAKNVTMFAYEATRYDATAHQLRLRLDPPPLLGPGPQPWSNVTKEEAEAACEKIGTGWRLCTAAEWLDACNGAGNTTFPYGDTYDAHQVQRLGLHQGGRRDDDRDRRGDDVHLRPVDDDAGDELYDMSGNVKEWVLTDDARPRGRSRCAAAPTTSPASPSARRPPRPACSATPPIPAPATAVRLPSVGFRCCLTGDAASVNRSAANEQEARGWCSGALAAAVAGRGRRARAGAAAEHPDPARYVGVDALQPGERRLAAVHRHANRRTARPAASTT